MARYKKQQLLESIHTLEQMNQVVRMSDKSDRQKLADALQQCQQAAIEMGTYLETRGEEGLRLVPFLEEYCELIYQQAIAMEEDEKIRSLSQKIQATLTNLQSGIANDLPEAKREVVFFPYKASMWDSLESIWMAANTDTDCDAYVVPIPYFDKNPDGTFGQMHYEGDDYPDYVPVTDWQTYDFTDRTPDAIFIHNPYDDCNYVTSVHPNYYSRNLKPFTEKLVYVPYYSTSGGMSEAQKLCPAYLNADYIVIQAPSYRQFFDESIPDEKFLPLGSPKFDKIIHKCQNPPQPPKEWAEKMEGKKVYFYNTSIGGMLADTEAFLKKMLYVFETFQGRDDACILWRPHPLLETTFDSMRPQYKSFYEKVKAYFIQNEIGIYDTTPDMTDAISWSDVYIGDAGSSLTSIFGIAGKPMFILNNMIHRAPQEGDWRGMTIPNLDYWMRDKFALINNNMLYESKPWEYEYHYVCDLTEYAYGNYYSRVVEVDGKKYACPCNCHNILVIGEKSVERKIELASRGEKRGAFLWANVCGKYIILKPLKYPALVRFNTETEEITYFEKFVNYCVRQVEDQTRVGIGVALNGRWEESYYFSPDDSKVYKLNYYTGEENVLEVPFDNSNGCQLAYEKDGWVYLTPFEGKVITRWNPETNEYHQYKDFPKDFKCIHPAFKCECEENLFSTMFLDGHYLYLSPNWGNMYLKLNVETGEMSEWKPPYEEKLATDYFHTVAKSIFVWEPLSECSRWVKMYSYPNRKLYRVNIETDEYEEIPIRFDVEELRAHEKGFCEESEWQQYCCPENCFNSLENLLDGNITGNQFDRDRQIRNFEKIAANPDGSCGKKVYEFIK